MESKKIKLADKEFDVPEMAIGRRKFLVPAIRNFYRDLNAKPQETRFVLEEKEYDAMIEMIVRAVFPQAKKDDILGMNVTDDQLFSAIFVIVEQCGLKSTEQKPGEAQGEETINSPITTP
jgi:hypothetical protein